MTTINIAGVVGVGKSSLCKILKEELKLQIFHEPFVDSQLLKNYYKDPKKYSLAMQIYFISKRFEMYKQAEQSKNVCIDRGIEEDKIFAQMLNQQGMLEDFEFEIYNDVYNNFYKSLKPADLIIYLQISPQNAIKRIIKRGRDYEIKKNKQYWYDLNEKYENYFRNNKTNKILTINVDNVDFVKNKKDKEFIIKTIKSSLDLTF